MAGVGIWTVDDVDDESGTLVNDRVPKRVPEVDLDGKIESNLESYKQAELEHAQSLQQRQRCILGLFLA